LESATAEWNTKRHLHPHFPSGHFSVAIRVFDFTAHFPVATGHPQIEQASFSALYRSQMLLRQISVSRSASSGVRLGKLASTSPGFDGKSSLDRPPRLLRPPGGILVEAGQATLPMPATQASCRSVGRHGVAAVK
jgi:hypothetical protein